VKVIVSPPRRAKANKVKRRRSGPREGSEARIKAFHHAFPEIGLPVSVHDLSDFPQLILPSVEYFPVQSDNFGNQLALIFPEYCGVNTATTYEVELSTGSILYNGQSAGLFNTAPITSAGSGNNYSGLKPNGSLPSNSAWTGFLSTTDITLTGSIDTGASGSNGILSRAAVTSFAVEWTYTGSTYNDNGIVGVQVFDAWASTTAGAPSIPGGGSSYAPIYKRMPLRANWAISIPAPDMSCMDLQQGVINNILGGAFSSARTRWPCVAIWFTGCADSAPLGTVTVRRMVRAEVDTGNTYAAVFGNFTSSVAAGIPSVTYDQVTPFHAHHEDDFIEIPSSMNPLVAICNAFGLSHASVRSYRSKHRGKSKGWRGHRHELSVPGSRLEAEVGPEWAALTL